MRPLTALPIVLAAACLAAVPSAALAASAPVLPPSVVVSAHRGGSAYAPENTMTAYRNAVRIGADQMETDTQLTSDNKLVLMHDAGLARTTSCAGNVQDLTLAAVEACDAGYWWTPGQGVTVDDTTLPHPLRGSGIRVPEAHELFDYIASLGPADQHTISIEIKNQPGDPSFDEVGHKTADVLVPLIEASGLKNRTIVQSFAPQSLTYVRMLDPTIKTQLLTIGAASPYLAYGAANGEDIISPDSTSPDVTAQFVTAAHADGKQVIPYTPDTADALTSTGLKGVDGEITNFPACMLDLEGRPHPAQLLPASSVALGSGPVPTCSGDSVAVAALPEAPWAVLLLAVGLVPLGAVAVRVRERTA